MIRMGKKTKKPPEEIIAYATEFFGGEWGMETIECGQCCARFEGAGGHVYVDIVEGTDVNEVEVQGREWEHQIRKFVGEL
ncbi:MAG: hypothetical protein PVF47_13165 [Anaerolineae bacterium]|jgi:hypothetical protein